MGPLIVLVLSQLFGIIGDLAGQRCVRVIYKGSAGDMLIGTSIASIIAFPVLSIVVTSLPESVMPAAEVAKWPSLSHAMEMVSMPALMAQMISLSVAFGFAEAWVYKSSWGAVLKNVASVLSPVLVLPLSGLTFSVAGTIYRCDGFVVALIIGAWGAVCMLLQTFVPSLPKLSNNEIFVSLGCTCSDVFTVSTMMAAFTLSLCYAVWSVALRNSHVAQGVTQYDWVFLEKVVGSILTLLCVAIKASLHCGHPVVSKEDVRFHESLLRAGRHTSMGIVSVFMYLLPLYARLALQFIWLAQKESSLVVATFWLNASRVVVTFAFSWCIKRFGASLLGDTSVTSMDVENGHALQQPARTHLKQSVGLARRCFVGRPLLYVLFLSFLSSLLLFALKRPVLDVTQARWSSVWLWDTESPVVEDVARVHVMAIGDWGCGANSKHSCATTGPMQRVMKTMARHAQQSMAKPTAVLNLGDTFYDHGLHNKEDTSNFMAEWAPIFHQPGLSGLPWHSVLGNHDYRGNVSLVAPGHLGPLQFPSRWYDWYSDHGLVHFIALDTNWVQSHDICRRQSDKKADYDACVARFDRDRDEQVSWLKRRLTGDKATWRIVFGHHPIYAAGKWAFYQANTDLTLIDALVPVFEQYGVHAYIAGHEHSSQHLRRNGIGYFIFGAGGADLDDEPGNTQALRASATILESTEAQHGFGTAWATSEKLCVATVPAISADTDSMRSKCFTSCLMSWPQMGWLSEPTTSCGLGAQN